MKIKMKRTATAKDVDGSEIVFGPADREYSTDEGLLTEKMADQLLKDKSAESSSKKRKSETTVKPSEV